MRAAAGCGSPALDPLEFEGDDEDEDDEEEEEPSEETERSATR